jgi:Ca-activated chloride channel family protein
MTFVFDTSGSMEGTRIKQAKAALKFCLSKLQPDDRFNVLSFASVVTRSRTSTSRRRRRQGARARVRRRARRQRRHQHQRRAPARARAPAPAGRPHLILFLTDGEPTSGETRADAIVRNVAAANRAGVRIFAFGVGASSTAASSRTSRTRRRGSRSSSSDQENIEEKVSRLQKKIATPVISELEIDWGQAEVSAVYPKSPGDLFAGTQLMVTGRYRKAGTFDVTLKGRPGTEGRDQAEGHVPRAHRRRPRRALPLGDAQDRGAPRRHPPQRPQPEIVTE